MITYQSTWFSLIIFCVYLFSTYRCVLNWFGDWSNGALYQVGREFTNKIDLEKTNVSLLYSDVFILSNLASELKNGTTTNFCKSFHRSCQKYLIMLALIGIFLWKYFLKCIIEKHFLHLSITFKFFMISLFSQCILIIKVLIHISIYSFVNCTHINMHYYTLENLLKLQYRKYFLLLNFSTWLLITYQLFMRSFQQTLHTEMQ